MFDYIGRLLSGLDEICSTHITPLIFEGVKAYSDALIKAVFKRMLIKFIFAVVAIGSLVLLYKFEDYPVRILAIVFSAVYLIFLADTLRQVARNSGTFCRLLKYHRYFIANELFRIKPWWLTAIQYILFLRGSLPSDEQISSVIISHIKYRLCLLIGFFVLYVVTYRFLVSLLIPLWGYKIAFYEQPWVAVITVFSIL